LKFINVMITFIFLWTGFYNVKMFIAVKYFKDIKDWELINFFYIISIYIISRNKFLMPQNKFLFNFYYFTFFLIKKKWSSNCDRETRRKQYIFSKTEFALCRGIVIFFYRLPRNYAQTVISFLWRSIWIG